MMEDLNGYQKGILIVMVVMTLVFAFLYFETISTVGYLYGDAILVPMQQNGATVYAGEIREKQAQFTVRDQAVSFRYGDKDFGEYTLKYDPTAVPEDNENASRMTGVEICHNGKILFRGGVVETNRGRSMYNEDGSQYYAVTATDLNGIVIDKNGNVIEPMTPSVSNIYDLLNDPELTHKGTALGWFGGVLICILNAVYIFMADELFYWRMSFHVREADLAEPTKWEIFRRHICWAALVLVALCIFILGLQ